MSLVVTGLDPRPLAFVDSELVRARKAEEA